jgi:hypothetical protein
MKKHIFFLAIVSLLWTGCMEMDQREEGQDHYLHGSWEVGGHSEEGMILKKVPKLKEGTVGYMFRNNGEMVERKSSSWCGTPMILADFAGRWSPQGANVQLNGKFWGGNYNSEWEILKMSGEEVTVKVVSFSSDLDS